MCALDQRRLWVAPRVSDIDDERDPTVVEDGLQTCVSQVCSSWKHPVQNIHVQSR